MRGVAAIAVLIVHLRSRISPIAAPSGALAVDLFFVLSGFIIAHAYENRIRGGLDVIEFLKIRAIRLYPLYLLGTLIGLAFFVSNVVSGGGNPSPGVAVTFGLAAILTIPLFRSDTPFGPYPLDPPAWSLLLEILVNFVYAIAFPFLSTWRLVFVVVAALTGLVLSGWLGGPLHGVVNAWDLFSGACRTLASFGSGLLVYKLRNVRKIRFSPLLLLAVCALVFSLDMSGHNATLWRFLTIFPLMPLLVWAGAGNEPSARFAGIFRFLGKTSYAVYALHWPVMVVTWRVLSANGLDANAYRPWVGIMFVVCMLITAALVDSYYDTPFRSFLSKHLLNRRAAPKLIRPDAA